MSVRFRQRSYKTEVYFGATNALRCIWWLCGGCIRLTHNFAPLFFVGSPEYLLWWLSLVHCWNLCLLYYIIFLNEIIRIFMWLIRKTSQYMMKIMTIVSFVLLNFNIFSFEIINFDPIYGVYGCILRIIFNYSACTMSVIYTYYLFDDSISLWKKHKHHLM